ncbi:hypothetical protein [Nocardioides convexus]|uniref:hypothetical protein n=1 Tax=Nocardioides convexus TaxID=2712224 RepID=UPI00241867AC|nr:hypothetical protein [Nocardioides convexus]
MTQEPAPQRMRAEVAASWERSAAAGVAVEPGLGTGHDGRRGTARSARGPPAGAGAAAAGRRARP